MSDSSRINALIEFYDSTSDSLPSWLDDHVEAEDNCPVLDAGSGTNAQKTAEIIKYELGSLNGWEAANIESPAPKPQCEGNDLFWAAAIGTSVRVYWSGGNKSLSVSEALDVAEQFGFDNDEYIRDNVVYPPNEDPPVPPGGPG